MRYYKYHIGTGSFYTNKWEQKDPVLMSKITQKAPLLMKKKEKKCTKQ